ncbi:hypothetical protein [Streptomyces luomodiensis]
MLVAQGCSNADIAEPTAKPHVSRILPKQGRATAPRRWCARTRSAW